MPDMRLEPLSGHEIRKLREAHGHHGQCLTCHEPQRCIPGRMLDTIAVRHLPKDKPPPPAEF